MNMEDVCYVYHIARPGMSLDEGYVGITKNLKKRWNKHKRANTHVGNAIRKYSDCEMVPLVLTTRELAVDLEKSLRPFKEIGWNVTEGGGDPPTFYGENHHMKNPEIAAKSAKQWTPEKREAHSERMRRDNPAKRPEVRAKLKANHAGKRPEVQEKLRQSWTDERRATQSEKVSGVSNPNFLGPTVALPEDNSKVGYVYFGQKQGCSLKFQPGRVSDVINGNRNQHKGYTFIRINKEVSHG